MKELLISVGVLAGFYGLLYVSNWISVRLNRKHERSMARYWAAYHAGRRGEWLNGEFIDSADNDTRRQ